MEFSHIPVLLSQCLDGLAIDPAGIYLDGTAGGAGHSKEIAKRLTTGRLISLDQDPDAVATAAARLKGLPAQVVQANFRETARVLDELEIPFINGALLDLGVSSHQLDDAERGFSYHADAPLDMRMSQQGPTAADLVNTLDREELTRILRDYGEEPYAWQIAGKIVKAREEAPILTTLQFADLIASAMPPAERRKKTAAAVPPSCAYWKNYKRARREHWQRGMALVTMPHSLRKAEILRYEKGGGAHGFHSSRNFNQQSFRFLPHTAGARCQGRTLRPEQGTPVCPHGGHGAGHCHLFWFVCQHCRQPGTHHTAFRRN